ncbi:alpha/beta hydrolase [Leptospira perolatii]|nr:alpha/beta hydrolase [Leptospira perolatii]
MASEKSTNDRAKIYSAESKFEFMLRRPEHAGSVATNLFFTPKRSLPSRKEQEVLSKAKEISFGQGPLHLKAWYWKNSGPLVYLVHGWNSHSGSLTRFVNPLLESGFSVASYDMPGHGYSEGKYCNAIRSADALYKLSEILGNPYGIITHSFGGAVATIAQEMGVRVERAVYIAPPATIEELRSFFCTQLGLSAKARDDMRNKIEKSIKRNMDTLDIAEIGKSLHSKLLVVHDLDDLEIPWEFGNRIAMNWEGAKMISTQGLGHLFILRDSAVIKEAVDFLSVQTGEGIGSYSELLAN